jgi:hypothetical protein
MIRSRLLLLALGISLALSSCAYESSGTTTTTTAANDEQPPPTGPAELEFGAQRIEGSTVVVDSVTLPATGFIVLSDDVGGSPGELIGLSEVIGPGRIDNVPVPFFVPLLSDALVHATVHVDIDRDRSFLYEPPDAFVDVPAVELDGTVASALALIELLPPLGPAEVVVPEARIDGTAVDVVSVTLPAPGFVAVQRNEAGLPGEVLGASGLLEAGTTPGLVIALDPPLRSTGLVWVVPYVDRDEDGVLTVGEGDEPGEVFDGASAAASPVMTVVPLDPSGVAVEDQEGEGISILVASATFPRPGFLDVRLDENGVPGRSVARSDLVVAPTVADFEITLDDPLDADATLWAQVRIDFDEDGEIGEGDRIGLTEDGATAETRFSYTFVEPDDEDEDEGGDG